MQTGERVGGRYLVGELLGRGGMGSVWRARDEKLGRDVALKFLEGFGGSEAERRFRREAQILAGLRHPGLVRVYDHGLDRGVPFIAQELVEGRDLADLVEQGGLLDPEPCRRLVRELAEALAYLHGRGVLHRDIKPGNVMLRPDGRFALMDFGLARTDTATALTQTGVIMGTPAYMPPEQLQGVPYAPDADVYQVGLVLHEVATGVNLHGDASDMHKFMLAMAAGKQVFTFEGAKLPEDLRGLVARCCARDPADRPRDGAELLRLVTRQAGTHAPAAAEPERRPVDATRPWRRWALVAGLVGAVVVGLGWGNWRRSSTVAPGPAVEALEWLQWPDGLELTILRPSGGEIRWRLTGDEVAPREGPVATVGGAARVELRGLPPGLRGRLVVEEEGRALGSWAVALPAEALREPVRARFGRSWVEVGWKLHGRGAVTLDVQPEGGPTVKRVLREDFSRVAVPIVEGKARRVLWRVSRGERLLAGGEGYVGVGVRTSLAGLAGLPELAQRPALHPTGAADHVVVAVPPAFLASLRPAPSPAGTTLVPDWVVAFSRRGYRQQKLGDMFGPGFPSPLALAQALPGGDCFVVLRSGVVGRLQRALRRAAPRAVPRGSWASLLEERPWDEIEPGPGECLQPLGVPVERSEVAEAGEGRFGVVATVWPSGGRRVEAWLVDLREGGLAVRRGEALAGAGGILGLVVAGERFLVAVVRDRDRPFVSAWVVDLLADGGPRVTDRQPLVTVSEVDTDDEKADAALVAVGPSRVVVALEQFIHVLDLDADGRLAVTRVAAELDESSKPQSAHLLDGGRLLLAFARRHHPMVNSPSRVETVVLKPGGTGAGGYAVFLRGPGTVVVRTVELTARSPWLLRGELFLSMPGNVLLGLRSGGDSTLAFRSELTGADVAGPLVELGDTIFAFGRHGNVVGCDMDAGGDR